MPGPGSSGTPDVTAGSRRGEGVRKGHQGHCSGNGEPDSVDVAFLGGRDNAGVVRIVEVSFGAAVVVCMLCGRIAVTVAVQRSGANGVCRRQPLSEDDRRQACRQQPQQRGSVRAAMRGK